MFVGKMTKKNRQRLESIELCNMKKMIEMFIDMQILGNLGLKSLWSSSELPGLAIAIDREKERSAKACASKLFT